MSIEKQAALYARVSTDKQEILNQLEQLREFCKKSGFSNYGEFWDITSGANDSRPSFDAMYLQAHQRRFQVVIFWSLDRFSRSGTLFTLQKLKELENLGIAWISYQEPYFSSIGPFRDVVISTIATIAKMERERISERTKAGLNRPGVRERVGKRGPDNKPRKWRKDKGIKRGVPKDKVISYMEAKEKETAVFTASQKKAM
jgi:DNA invertase Pin-like site-specific DNA recombinase